MAKPTPPAASATPAAKTVERPVVLDDCYRYRNTRVGPKWRAGCEAPRVTKKPAPTPADTARPELAGPVTPDAATPNAATPSLVERAARTAGASQP